MSPTSSEIAAADLLTRRRARMLPVLAAIFIAQQAAYFSQPDTARLVDQVKIGAWVVLSIVLLLLLVTGGFWFKPRPVRALMDDDSTRSNRASALALGFVVTLSAAIALYAINLYAPMNAREVIHLLTTLGIGSALLRFGYLERRDLKE